MMATIQQLQQYAQNPNVRRFLDVIAQAEGTTGYDTAFGGGTIPSLADHPRQLHSFTQTDGRANKTSAAGRYQFLQGTWDDVAGRLGLTDFGPQSQDIAAVELLRRNGSLEPLLQGDFQTALDRSGTTWASLPSSPYAQPKRSPGFIAGALDKASEMVFPAAHAGTLPLTGPTAWKDVIAKPEYQALSAEDKQRAQEQYFNEVVAPRAPKGQIDAVRSQFFGQYPVMAGNADDGGVVAGILQGVRDPIDAGAQMLRRAVPDGVGRAVDQFGNTLAGMGLPVARSQGVQGVDQIVNDVNQRYQAGRQAAGRDGIDWARLGGNLIGTAPLIAATPSMAGSGLTARIGTGAAQGAGFGFMSPVVGENAQQNFGSEKLTQGALGGALGGVTPMISGAIGRVISPKASRPGSAAKLLANEGVTLTPGQIAGGAAMRVEDRLMSAPILGDAIRGARIRGNEQLNRAVYNRVLAPIGRTTSKVGREAVDDVSNKVSQAYDDVLSKVQFSPDGQLAQDIARLRQIATGLPDDAAKTFERELQRNVIEPLSKGVSIDGRAFKDIETQLGRRADRFLKSNDVPSQDIGDALVEVQKALRNALVRVNPQHAKELSNVNASFAQLARLQDAASRIGAEDGVFTPAQLSSAVRAGDKTVRKNSYARGNALMQGLSDAARERMMSKVPDSGTAERLLMNVLAGGGAYALNPVIPAGLAAASVPYLPGIGRAASGLLTSRPQAAQSIANQLQALPPGLLGILAGQ